MSNRYLVDVLPGQAWKGERCFILGGGPSLKDFDFDLLKGEKVIAVNRAIESAPWADIMFSIDTRLYTWFNRPQIGLAKEAIDAFQSFRGLRVWCDASGKAEFDNDVLLVNFKGRSGLSTDLAQGIYTGGNSGYAALQLATCLGANPIYLLGFDMDDKGNYHSGYPTPGSDPKCRGWVQCFDRIAPKLETEKIQVINLNPKSKLKCFPMGEILQAKDKRFVTISFYTIGTGYEVEIKNLEASLKRFGLPYYFFPCFAKGTWRKNLNYKSEYILKALDLFPDKDIVFIDADGIVRQYPVLFDQLSVDRKYNVAACFRKYALRSGDSDELMSGTLWFQNNKGARDLVKLWHKIGLEHPEIRHQKCLRMAIEQRGTMEKKTFRLPAEYTYVFDYHYPPGTGEPVIEHFQASRRLRNDAGYGVDMINRNAR